MNAVNENNTLTDGQLRRERQKRKAVAYFVSGGNMEYIGMNDVGLRPGVDDQFYEQIQERGVDKQLEEDLLRKIDGPLVKASEKEVFEGNDEREGILGYRQEQKILAEMSGAGFDSYEQVKPSDVGKFLEKYPTPLDFKEDADAFLGDIKRDNSEAKFLQYVEAMEGFQKKVYGKKYEYFIAVEEIEKDARERAQEKQEQGEQLSREELREVGRKVGRRMERLLKRLAEGQEMTPEDSERMLESAKIEGAPYFDFISQEEKVLTTDVLKEAELAPTYEMELEGVKYGFSDVFRVGERKAVIGYVEKDNNVYARSYYASGSQGVWRYLPDRIQSKTTGRVSWLGKGPNEEALNLPSEVQSVLNKRAMSENFVPFGEMTDEQLAVQRKRAFSFYGTAGSTELDVPRIPGDGKDDALAREVNYRPSVAFNVGVEPQRLSATEKGQEPDFERKVLDYQASSDIYGKYNANVFKSKDGSLKWTIMEDESGKAWVGQVEMDAPITSTGLRAEWVASGGFGVPAYEYPDYAEGYGDNDDVIATSGYSGVRYVSMWKNYLAKIPMIQEFKAKQAESRASS